MDVGANTTGSILEDLLCDKADLQRLPILGTFEIIPTCNMDCEMCYVRMKQEDVTRLGGLRSVDFWVNLAKDAMDAGMLFLLITGGEPLLYPHFKELFIQLQEMGLILTMNTNGTLINEEWAKFFGEHNLRRLNITIYGKDDETYHRLCHNPKGFTQLEKAVRLLHENNVDVRLNCSLTAYNYDQYEDFRRIAEAWKCPIEFSYYMFPPNRKIYHVDYEKSRMTPKQAAEVAFKIHTYKQDPKEVAKAKLSQIVPEGKKMKNGFMCRSGNSAFWVNWKGELGACGIMNEPVESIDTLGFAKAWDSLKDDVQKIQLSKKCWECPYLALCPHCAAGEVSEGEFGIAPQYQCDFMDAYIQILNEELEK